MDIKELNKRLEGLNSPYELIPDGKGNIQIKRWRLRNPGDAIRDDVNGGTDEIVRVIPARNRLDILEAVKELEPAAVKEEFLHGELINLTPHDIKIVDDEGNMIAFISRQDVPARCSVERKQIGWIKDYPLYKTSFGEVENLPSPQEGKYFIVSRIIAEAMKGKRNDLVVPDNTVRDNEGRIIGCKGFSRL